MEIQTVKPAETTVAAIVNNNAEPETPSRVEVVTNENFDAYVDKKLPPKPEDPVVAAELAEEEEKKEKAKADKGKKKSNLDERFSELTTARKSAEEAAEKARQEAKQAREEREAAIADAAALRAKYEPPKTEPDPEPQPSQFTDPAEYGKALKEWTADNVRREDAKKAREEAFRKEAEAKSKTFQERVAAHKEKNPEYEKKIEAADVKVSQAVSDAIVESEVGPAILEYLAAPENSEYAKNYGPEGWSVTRSLRELGKLEAKLSGEPAKDGKEPQKTISKAPAPISPIRGEGAPVTRLSGSDAVPSGMSYEQWKKLRQSGKIH